MKLNPSQRKQLVESFTDEEFRAANWWLLEEARDKQIPPPDHGLESDREDPWLIWLVLAGRGFGKTRTGAEWVIERARGGYGPIALIGETAGDVRDTMVETRPASIMQISPPGFVPHYEPSKRRLTWPNGVIAHTYSGDAPDQLRGPEHQTVWADECAKWKYSTEAWDNMEFGLRYGEDPRCVATTTPRPTKLIRSLVDDPDVIVVTGTTYENEANLAERFRKRVISKYEGTRLGRQELHAVLLLDAPGALWTRQMVEDALYTLSPPAMKRVVVAIDPAVSSNVDSDETGILVCGLGIDDHGYILDDGSGQYTPSQWAKEALRLYDKYEADRIVAEVNNGGDLVERNIRVERESAAYKQVRATRGKQLRAEPVAALYEQGRVHHVGAFPELEDQMTQWEPSSDEGSPDRLDAAVYGLTELIVDRPPAPRVPRPQTTVITSPH